jgi:hypothetical protein
MHKRSIHALLTKEIKNTNVSNSIKNIPPQPQKKRKKKPLNEMEFMSGKAAII